MKHILIGIAGAALTERGEFLGTSRVGKDTLANEIVRQHGAVKMGFADPIRDFVTRLVGCAPEYIEAHKGEPMNALCGKSPRQAMQTLGTEWGRQMIGDGLWVNAAMVSAARVERVSGSPVVFTDVRFGNEAEAIILQGGIVVEVIRIMRPGQAVTYNVHPSERRMPDQYISGAFYSDAGPDWAREAAARFPKLIEQTRGIPVTWDEE